ncbi:Carrier domain-containing protein OS=Streptomyces antimycoticus OX=68175 GN=SSPO_056070 PE=4 SV=1 [Streptomyces antimycoticus]
MLQAVWFDAGPDVAGRLLLTIHHLAVDGVSWRILLPDLTTAWSRTDGDTSGLDAVGTSFREWAQRLTDAAQRPERIEELQFWLDTLAEPDPALADRPLDPARDITATTRRLILTLPTEQTSALLTTVPAAFHARMNDVLLSAFAAAVTQWRAQRGHQAGHLLVNLEGHGREELDVHRPVPDRRLVHQPVPGTARPRPTTGPSTARAVRRPAGCSSGSRSNCTPCPTTGSVTVCCGTSTRRPSAPSRLPEPQISFNYLGRVPAAVATAEATSAEAPAPDGFDLDGGSDPERPLAHTVDITAMTQDLPDGPRLVADVSWAGELLSEDEVRELGHNRPTALTALVRHAEGPQAGGYSPSDDAGPADPGRDRGGRVRGGERLEDVLPLTPMQEPLFHAQFDEDEPDLYTVQLGIDLAAPCTRTGCAARPGPCCGATPTCARASASRG